MSNTTLRKPTLDFEPVFYIMDRCKLTVLAAKKQDKYEVSGVYVKFNEITNTWAIWPANFNNQLPWEYPTRFEVTKNENEAWSFLITLGLSEPLTDEMCLQQFPRSEDFPKY